MASFLFLPFDSTSPSTWTGTIAGLSLEDEASRSGLIAPSYESLLQKPMISGTQRKCSRNMCAGKAMFWMMP